LTNVGLSNQVTGYASQRIWCLSQARINLEGCARKGIWHKMVGMAEVVVPISQDGVAIHPDYLCVCLCYLHFPPQNPEDANKDMTYGYHPVDALTCLHKQEVGKSSWNAAQPCAGVKGCVNDYLRVDGLQKGSGFRVGT